MPGAGKGAATPTLINVAVAARGDNGEDVIDPLA